MKFSYTDPHYVIDNKLREVDCHYTLPNMPEWIEVQVVYPFGIVVARVRFIEKGNPSNWVSTYLDAFDSLGVAGKPYFELYPAADGGTERFLLSDKPQLYERVIVTLESRRLKLPV